MIAIKNILIVLSIFVIFYSCEGSKYRLVDDFAIYLSSSGKSWEFDSQLGCSENPKAKNVKLVKWNKNIIIIENENEANKVEFFIIYSQHQELKSCFIDNLVLGPLTIDEVKKFNAEHKIGKLKEKGFKISR